MRGRLMAMAMAVGLLGSTFGFLGLGVASAAPPRSCHPGAPSPAYPPGNCRASEGSSAVQPGGSEHVDGEGFMSNSSVSVYLNPGSVFLGSGTASATGVLGLTVTIPSSVSPGSHELVELGKNPDGSTRQLTAALQVVAAAAAPSTTSSSGALPFTGAQIAGMSVAGLALVLGGGFMLLAARRRRTNLLSD